MLASFFDKEGAPLQSSPEQTLRKAYKAFRDVTGYDFYAMGELEYYVISEDTGLFPASDRKDTRNRLPMQSSTISAPSAWHS